MEAGHPSRARQEAVTGRADTHRISAPSRSRLGFVGTIGNPQIQVWRNTRVAGVGGLVEVVVDSGDRLQPPVLAMP